MNVELLRRIQAHNTAHPENLDFSQDGIAGIALALSSGKSSLDFVEMKAAKVLGINWDQAQDLFYIPNWPGDFESLLAAKASGTPEYAAIVNARIDRFIETGGAE